MSDLSLTDEELSLLSNVIASRLGLFFPKERWVDLVRNLENAFKQFKVGSPNEIITSLIKNSLTQKQLDILAGCLTIGETYFFRDQKFFERLEEYILPEIINSRKNNDKCVRIWCAGCSTGEEPYSVSILLHKLLPDISEWKIMLLATDINIDSLKKMETGIYNEWSFRNVEPVIKQKYFSKTPDNRFKIHDKIKRIVTTKYLNLAEDCYPSLVNNTNAMDIIICRNVLMYFSPDNSKNVVSNFYKSLVDNGWLVVSPSETSQTLFKQYKVIHLPDAIFYRKVVGIKSHDVIPHIVFTDEVIAPKNDFETDQFLQDIIKETVEETSSADEVKSDTQTLPVDEKEQTQSRFYREALEQFHVGLYYEAKESIKKYFRHNYNDEEAHLLLAKILANEGNMREAFAWCEKAISLNKMNPLHHYLMASILQEQNRVDEAITAIKRALYLNCNFVIGHFVLGNIYLKLGRYSDSRKSFNNALKLLEHYPPDFVPPESDGMTAKRLIEIINSTTYQEV
ncbi:MAG: CheR family methyltransferase [Bacteroidota bacterium]